jgi:hypothetical protein
MDGSTQISCHIDQLLENIETISQAPLVCSTVYNFVLSHRAISPAWLTRRRIVAVVRYPVVMVGFGLLQRNRRRGSNVLLDLRKDLNHQDNY